MSPSTSGRAAVDWSRLRQRLEAAGLAIHGEAELPAEQAQRILEERARALARPAQPLEAELGGEWVVFHLGEQRCALEARYVMAVFRPTNVAPLPGIEPPVAGIVAWRGELLTVLDLRSVLDAAPGAATQWDWVLVLGREEPAFGLRVDVVEGMAHLSPGAIRPTPDQGIRGGAFLRGITDEAVLVLDAESILDSQQG